MKNLAKLNATDFTITESGDAFISQRKASEALGIPLSTLNRWVLENGTPALVNEINQLGVILFQKAVLLGQQKGSEKAFLVAEKLLEAGAKAYIYHEAGYQMQAHQVPKTFGEALRLAGDLQDKLEAEQARSLMLTHQVEDLAIELDRSKDWVSIKRLADFNKMSWKAIAWQPLKRHGLANGLDPHKVFDANFPNGVNVYHKDTIRAVYPHLLIPGDDI